MPPRRTNDGRRAAGLPWPHGRRVKVLAYATAGLLLAGAAWIAVTGVLAAQELLAAQRKLETLRPRTAASQSAAGTPAEAAASKTRTAEAAVRGAAEHAARAHRLTTGPAWYPAAQLPVLGAPLRTVRGIAEASDRLAGDVLSPLARTAGEVGAGPGDDGGLLNLSAVRRAAPLLDHASRSAARVRTEVDALPHRTWLPAADRARTRLARRLDRLRPLTGDAAAAARVLPSMLGADGPRRYLVVFENTAEARGTGGLPGAFAVLRADRGRMSFERFGNDTELASVKADVDLGAEYDALYGPSAPAATWVNSNVSPHFPYAARIWAAAWHRHSGQRVNGAISLDPSVVSALLAASGPVRLPDGNTVTAGNVVDLTERASYAVHRNTARRKAFFLDVARAVATRLLDAAEDPARRPALVAALHRQLAAGRIKVWSAHPAEERELLAGSFGGALPDGSVPLAGLVVNNAAGTKLDYYLDRELVWAPGRCVDGRREITVTARLTNRAPESGLPPYVTQRVDDPLHDTRPGDNRLLVSYYASAGAMLSRATLDGRPALVNHATERGHPVFTLDLELPARSTRTLVLHLLEPPTGRAPVVLRQPLVRPLRATVRQNGPCGA
ncbi:DUF4012 domain-containing protein [Streptomyces sp. MNU89]|uniref:DUF4012 domain-containing protein n=1 Tax=Streptomyces sp. MNU89 TaxID=2560025 RepID=UPI001E402482|nr:DUF4012 domain-containing protein [Streptomyces sp. MNU89]MCC9740255.1 DUF4012 domain-containing protein [Streptomyces sp. MNU89]